MTELELLRDISRMNLEEIKRRIRQNDPVETRNIPGTDIHIRVWGFVSGNPVLDCDDWDKFTQSCQ